MGVSVRTYPGMTPNGGESITCALTVVCWGCRSIWSGFCAPIPDECGCKRKKLVTPIEAAKLIEEKLSAASGKPVLVHRDPNFAGHASIKIASEDAPAHLLRYKPEFESELPYLSAFQCGMALRSIQAKTVNRFDLASAQRWAKKSTN